MQTRLCRDGAGEVLLIRSGPGIISLGLMFLCFGLSQLMLVKSRFLFEVNTLLDFSSERIVSPSRCLELHPNNLTALLALAVSLTNTGMRHDACEALLRWLRHNPKYKQLVKGKTHLTGSPNSQRRMSHAPNLGRHER